MLGYRFHGGRVCFLDFQAPHQSAALRYEAARRYVGSMMLVLTQISTESGGFPQ